MAKPCSLSITRWGRRSRSTSPSGPPVQGPRFRIATGRVSKASDPSAQSRCRLLSLRDRPDLVTHQNSQTDRVSNVSGLNTRVAPRKRLRFDDDVARLIRKLGLAQGNGQAPPTRAPIPPLVEMLSTEDSIRRHIQAGYHREGRIKAVSSAAVPGTTIRGTSARPTASGSRPTPGTTIWASVSGGRLPREPLRLYVMGFRSDLSTRTLALSICFSPHLHTLSLLFTIGAYRREWLRSARISIA
jgi:hypothetical protein